MKAVIGMLFPKIYTSNSQCENLMCRILYQMDSWGDLPTWDQYFATMSQEGVDVASWVKRDFDMVIGYLQSPAHCAEVCKDWNELYYLSNS